MRFIPILLLVSGLGAVTACQTAPAPDSGFLSDYGRLETNSKTLRASIRAYRDDAAVDRIETVYLEPSRLLEPVDDALDPDARAMVLREVDRQVCYELSERYDIAPRPEPGAGRVRLGIVSIAPTGRAGAAASAVANNFIPGPIGLRAPRTTGALAVEAEMLEPETGRQIAALAWARQANVIGTDDPSLSRVGDAMQFAEPLGDEVGKAFASEDREHERQEPDPCAAYGPRFTVASFTSQRAMGFATGLYVPQLDTVELRPDNRTAAEDGDGAVPE